MSNERLDEIDKAILHLLQQDARHLTPVDMAKELPVSDGTVRNRIEKMEADNVIQGYVPTINYENAGFPLKIVFTCTASVDQRSELVDDTLDIHGVVNVRELMAPRENVQVVGIAVETADITRIARELNDIGLELERENLMQQEHVNPFNHLGEDAVDQL